MAEQPKAGNGEGREPSLTQQAQVRVIAQYIKDLSFENPNVRKLLDSQGEPPNLRVEVNVNATQDRRQGVRKRDPAQGRRDQQSRHDLRSRAVLRGHVSDRNMPEASLEPFLLINCPALLFPFARRLVADLTREGGFPPLLLDPIDFGGLFVKRQQEKQAQAQPKLTN